ncbi:MAG: hypothetical protein ABI542_10710 [Gemmatimonadota bacterium]
MISKHNAWCFALLAFTTIPATAQQRTIDLTGSPDQTIDKGFSAVSHGVQIGNGSFAFVDGMEVAIYVADFRGGQVQAVGRPGAGPNEYRRPSKAIADGKGGAIVPDAPLGRAFLLSATGEARGSGYMRQDIGGISPTAIHGIDPRGGVILFGRSPQQGADSLPIQRWDPGTHQLTTLAWWPMIRTTVGPSVKTRSGAVGRELSTPAIWPERTAWLVLSDGTIAIVRPDPYRVDFITEAGRAVRGPTTEYVPVKVTPGKRKQIRDQRGPMSDDQFPAMLPPFEGFDDVIGSEDDEVWVGRMRDAADSVPVYDIFDRAGAVVAHARLRPHTKVVGFGERWIYVARQSLDDDLWHLERYARR